MLVTESRILILDTEGHILLPGAKDYKVWFLYVQRQFVAL